MANHSFINEEKFYSQTRSSVYYKNSVIVRGAIDIFLYFVTRHHFSSNQIPIKHIGNNQYSCLVEIKDESNNIFHCGIKYNELENKKLKIISVNFNKQMRQD